MDRGFFLGVFHSLYPFVIEYGGRGPVYLPFPNNSRGKERRRQCGGQNRI
jgi:hypothetical protein